MVVRATGSSGQPASGVTVTWAVQSGPGYTQDQSTTTDANGLTNTFFTGIAPDMTNSFYPSTVTATAGSSTVSFVMTTVHSPTTSVSARVITPSFGATLTAPSGTTISDALQVQVFVNDGFQSGSGLPNVGLTVQSYPDPTVTPSATCNAPSGIALSDSTGTATCNLNVTGAPGSSQLLGLIGGTFLENPIFNLQITPGAPCTYSLSASSQSFTSAAGTGSVNVITTSACAWTAVSNANFITLTSGASGTGNGTVSYSVSANNGVARTGTLTVAGKTYTVNQSAATSLEWPCRHPHASSGGQRRRQLLRNAHGHRRTAALHVVDLRIAAQRPVSDSVHRRDRRHSDELRLLWFHRDRHGPRQQHSIREPQHHHQRNFVGRFRHHERVLRQRSRRAALLATSDDCQLLHHAFLRERQLLDH